ncbi:glycoside hydrolase family 13 protein [Neptunicella sp. SCSIO 80796]|uniref:glycoside hydrolase family 13 protein n=1 Tax=Neptunicella plasticusilytica TaxID=3117012 RepID=UPI003A4D60F5
MKRMVAWVGLMMLSANTLAAVKIDHLEPLSWWAGMQQPELQLMVHGHDIGDLTVQLDYPGVKLESVQAVDNANYLFINLLLDKQVKPGKFDIQFVRDGKVELRYPYHIQARRQGSAQRQGFSSKDAIYLITPDRFANGDSANDSVASLADKWDRADIGGRHGGDIQGIIDHLDYIKHMGFNQIWLMPVLENAQDSYSYHGYSTTDYYQIDPRYGDNQLYKSLSAQAAKQGIGLIKDVILNHIGSGHWWMQDKPTADWIHHQGQFVGTTHRREALRDPHGVKSDRVAFSDGWFVPSMPDLNQRNPLLATYLIQNSIWWIEYANLSGIRLDTYSYPDKDFLADYTQRIMQEYPNFNLVGEEWSLNPAIVSYWQKDSVLGQGYPSALPSLMDFPLQHALVSGLNEAESFNGGLAKIYQALSNDFLYADPGNLVIFPDNHDMSRITTELNQDNDLLKMAFAFFATTRGIPQFFYGDEVLMSNQGTEDHGIIRSDFPGGWSNDQVNAFNGQGLTGQQQQVQQYLAKLLNWRQGNEAVTSGKLTHYAPQDGVYVYFRYTDKQKVMVVLNKGGQRQLDLNRYREMLGNATQGQSVICGQNYSFQQPISLAAKSALILQWTVQ